MDVGTLKMLTRLEGLGRVSVELLPPSTRTSARFWIAKVDGVEIKDNGILTSTFGDGPTPESAIRDLWVALTKLSARQYLVVNAYETRGPRSAYRWNEEGSLWQPVVEPPEDRIISGNAGMYGGRDK